MPTTTTTTSYIIKRHKRASAQGMDLAEFRIRYTRQGAKAPFKTKE